MRFIGALAFLVLVAACGGTPTETTSTSLGTTTSTTLGTTTTTAPPAPGYTNEFGTVVRFVDVTAEAGIEMVRSLADVVGDKTQDTRIMRGGAAAGDFDGDGDMDLFMIGADGPSDRYYVNDGTGRFTDGTAAAGLERIHMGSGATVADVDGDGDLDLYVTSHGDLGAPSVGRNLFYVNDGTGKFTERAADFGLETTSAEIPDGFGAAFGDIDLDGDLDLFVAGWQRDSKGNRLLIQDDDGTFRDVTDEAGIVDDGIRGFSPCIVDTDGDRYPEILLVADFGTSRYFINNGDGTFSESTLEADLGQEWSGMGVAVGDVDRDGMVDLYATAIYDDAGVGRGNGNKLYRNLGGHDFAEVAGEAGVADGGWGWGAAMFDIDLDGMIDIMEVNGWTMEEYESDPVKVWMNAAGERFFDVGAAMGLDYREISLSIVDFDMDGDGDRDVLFTSPDGPSALYRADLEGSATSWLTVRLDTSSRDDLAPMGLGSVVTVETDTGDVMTHAMSSCANYLSGVEPMAHFGLGDATTATVTVVWPDGTGVVVPEVAANQAIVVTP